jgi:hypothetical protein
MSKRLDIAEIRALLDAQGYVSPAVTLDLCDALEDAEAAIERCRQFIDRVGWDPTELIEGTVSD